MLETQSLLLRKTKNNTFSRAALACAKKLTSSQTTELNPKSQKLKLTETDYRSRKPVT